MKRIISLLLVILLLGTVLVGCKKDEEEKPQETSGTGTTEIDDFPDIAKQDNGGKDFNVLYPMWSLYEKYYFALEANGELINDANFERQSSINEHLGVKIVGLPTSAAGGQDAIHVVSEKLRTAAKSGDDPYQLALTHCFVGVMGNVIAGSLVDYGTVECLDLDADYWRKADMEYLSVKGKMYLGSGRFLLYDPTVTIFNKDMLNNADASFNADDLYQLVTDKKWTIAKMKEYASSISADQNEGVAEGEGTYGYVCQNNWEPSSFMAASDYYVVTKDQSTGKHVATIFSQKIDDIYGEVKSLFDQPYTYKYGYSATSEYISSDIMKEGRAMFGTMSLMAAMKAISESEAKIGILPNPAYAEGIDVKSLDWAGFMVIPSSVTNLELSGAVAELLCYYGQKKLYPAFYDKLLGTRTAENYKDAEMLDLIFGGMVSDPGLAFMEASPNLNHLFYMFMELISANSTEVSSFMATYTKGVDKTLEFK